MAFRTIHVAVLLASMPIVGCGTCANLVKLPQEEGGKTPFGGVRHDMSRMNNTASRPAGFGACCDTATKALCVADLPLSFVGDVVTWPYTAAYTFINEPIPTPPVAQAPAVFPTQPTPAVTLPEPKKAP